MRRFDSIQQLIMGEETVSIESNVPLVQARGGYCKHPWKEMEVGDSFFVAGTTVERLSSLAVRAGRRLAEKFTCRTVKEQGVPGVRVWRVQ
jgi:hypothetical protein